MRRIHIALAVDNIDASIADYTRRLEAEPAVVVPNRYALWRTPEVNLSITIGPVGPGSRLRHLGFEDDDAPEPSQTADVNSIVWERFTAEQQDTEIDAAYGPTP